MNSNAMTTVTDHVYLAVQHHSIFKTDVVLVPCFKTFTFKGQDPVKVFTFHRSRGPLTIPQAKYVCVTAQKDQSLLNTLYLRSSDPVECLTYGKL